MGSSYLLATISSVIDNTSAQDKTEVVVVVFLADADEEYNNQVLAKIMEQFSEFVAMGFIQVVQVSADYYPKLDGLKRNFNDKPDRVHWRAKQVADFTFMFSYAQNLSTYYIQIEDDVICAHGFVSAIRSFISHQKHWAVLEFSELGFIGKLFKSADLDKLSRYMMTFYDEQPVDWLITYFRLSMAQKNIIMRKPTLFQHVGLKSSFDTSKDNKLKDRFFDAGEKKLGDNPPATIITNMRAFEKYTPDLAYSPGNGYFWASGLSQNDSLYVIFDSDQVLEGIVVETGDVKHPKDVLNVGWVEASPKVRDMDVQKKTVVCENLTKIAVFRNGRAEAVHLSRVLSEKTRCLRVVVGASQSQWVIFYQIAVFVKSPWEFGCGQYLLVYCSIFLSA